MYGDQRCRFISNQCRFFGLFLKTFFHRNPTRTCGSERSILPVHGAMHSQSDVASHNASWDAIHVNLWIWQLPVSKHATGIWYQAIWQWASLFTWSGNASSSALKRPSSFSLRTHCHHQVRAIGNWYKMVKISRFWSMSRVPRWWLLFCTSPVLAGCITLSMKCCSLCKLQILIMITKCVSCLRVSRLMVTLEFPFCWLIGYDGVLTDHPCTDKELEFTPPRHSMPVNCSLLCSGHDEHNIWRVQGRRWILVHHIQWRKHLWGYPWTGRSTRDARHALE